MSHTRNASLGRGFLSSCHTGNKQREPSYIEVDWEPRGLPSISPAYLSPVALSCPPAAKALPSLRAGLTKVVTWLVRGEEAGLGSAGFTGLTGLTGPFCRPRFPGQAPISQAGGAHPHSHPHPGHWGCDVWGRHGNEVGAGHLGHGAGLWKLPGR